MVRESNHRVLESFCVEQQADNCGVVIFGASGDLTRRKLLPALFSLFVRDLLPEHFFVLGYARTPKSDHEFRDEVRDAVAGNDEPNSDAERIGAFADRCYYLPGNYNDPDLYRALGKRIGELDRMHDCGGNVAFYLSVPPTVYGDVVMQLGEAGLVNGKNDAWRRVVIEKPFGHDVKSAEDLNETLHTYLVERQIYRIDHYLGKDTVQNILMYRFANSIFEPLWDRNYIEHVEITAAEDIGVGHRAGYYDANGLLRDMFQNHMLELLALVGMEPPCALTAECIRDEKIKLLRAIRPFPKGEKLNDVLVRGQYDRGSADGEEVAGYREESGVAPDSRTETFVAARLFIDNWRWQGVPFLLRSGKRLKRRCTEIAVTYKPVPHSVFHPLQPEHLGPNVVVIRIQPDEGVGLEMQAKKPGPHLCMSSVSMDFRYKDAFGRQPQDAYSRLLLDCMLGDQTLFIRNDTIVQAWKLLAPILQTFSEDRAPGEKRTRVPLHRYEAGSAGPQAAYDLVEAHGFHWRKL